MFACLLLALSMMTTSAAPTRDDTSAQGITLRRDVRAQGVQQLKCLSGPACGTTAEPDQMLCRRPRSNSMDSVTSSDADSDWECDAALPAGVRIGKAEIACGGAGSSFRGASTHAALTSSTVSVPATSSDQGAGDHSGNRSGAGAAPTSTATTPSRTARDATATAGAGTINASAAFSAPHECRVQYTLIESLEQGRHKAQEQQQQQRDQPEQGAGTAGFFLAYLIFLALNHGLGDLLCRWLGIDAANSRVCALLWRVDPTVLSKKPSDSLGGGGRAFDAKARRMPAALAAAMAGKDGGTTASKSRSPDDRRSGRGMSSASPVGRKSKRR